MALFNYECDEVKRIIDEVSPNYPQLTTYEKEWLFFHKYHYIPGVPVELEYETVNVYPNGIVSNAIPFQYKRAILKGQTLENLVGEKRYYTNNGTSNRLRGWEFMLPYNLTKGKTYMAVFNATGTISETNSKVFLMDDFNSTTGNTNYAVDFKAGYNMVKCVASSNNHKVLRIRTKVESSGNVELSYVMLIEYQDGMENWDIPFFEGTQSVQIPVLTISNENDTKTNILTINENITLRSNGDVYDEVNLLTGRLTQRIGENNEVLSQEVVKTVAIQKLNKPYEGTNHYHLTSNIPCEAILEVPVVSTGKQTLEEIND